MQQSSENAAELRNGGALRDGAYHWYAELPFVEKTPSRLSRRLNFRPYDERDQPAQKIEAVFAAEITERQEPNGRDWEALSAVDDGFEHRLEFRDEGDQKDGHDDNADGRQNARINHRAFNTGLNFLLIFDEFRGSFERGLQEGAFVSRANNAQRQIVEDFAV